MATTDTCPTCGNAHSGECTPAALKARIAALNLDRDAYRKAKAENDERFMVERDEARRERDALRAQLAEAKATIARLNRLAH